MWSEMSYNKYQMNLTLSQRFNIEYEDEDEYIGDFDELNEADIFVFN